MRKGENVEPVRGLASPDVVLDMAECWRSRSPRSRSARGAVGGASATGVAKLGDVVGVSVVVCGPDSCCIGSGITICGLVFNKVGVSTFCSRRRSPAKTYPLSSQLQLTQSFL